MINTELVLLHALVLTELKSIAKFGAASLLILRDMREEIYKHTGFPLVEPFDQKTARQVLKGPRYRMLSRLDINQEFDANWLNVTYAGQLYDNGHMDVQFGGLVLEDGVIRPMTSADQALVSNAAEEYSASK